MKNRLCEYDVELFNQICDAKDFPNIIGTQNNKLDNLWCRNFKKVIKVGASIIIKGLPSNTIEDKGYFASVDFEITPKQAKEIIEELQKVLKNRTKKT